MSVDYIWIVGTCPAEHVSAARAELEAIFRAHDAYWQEHGPDERGQRVRAMWARGAVPPLDSKAGRDFATHLECLFEFQQFDRTGGLGRFIDHDQAEVVISNESMAHVAVAFALGKERADRLPGRGLHFVLAPDEVPPLRRDLASWLAAERPALEAEAARFLSRSALHDEVAVAKRAFEALERILRLAEDRRAGVISTLTG